MERAYPDSYVTVKVHKWAPARPAAPGNPAWFMTAGWFTALSAAALAATLYVTATAVGSRRPSLCQDSQIKGQDTIACHVENAIFHFRRQLLEGCG
jgi:hypothetical protein